MNIEPGVAVLMMQRNEKSLLAAWIQYHAALFGLEHLWVFDDNSNDVSVRDVLTDFESRGLNVFWLDSSSLLRKAEIFGSLIRKLDCDGRYFGYIPLDCDEFVCLEVTPTRFSLETCDIRQELERLKGSDRLFKVTKNLPNILGRPGWFRVESYSKVLLPSGVLLSADIGFHHAISRTGLEPFYTRICYIHFHYKPYEEMIAATKLKLSGRVNINDRHSLETFRGDGWHLAEHLLMTERDYNLKFSSGPAIFCSEVIFRFRYIGVKYPFTG